MKTIYCIIIATIIPTTAIAECVTLTNYYTKCKSKYYLTDTNTCRQCPPPRPNGSNEVHGSPTSDNENSTDIGACYMPAGEYSDTTGNYVLTENCHYS